MEKSKPYLSSEFLYYLLSSDEFFSYNMDHAQAAKMPHGDKEEILNFQIPVPGPEKPARSSKVQATIVQVLEAFSELTNELTSELVARKNNTTTIATILLSFKECEVEWKPLGEIGEFIRGKRFTKDDYVDNGVKVIHYGEIYTRYGVWTDRVFSQVGR